MPLAEALATNSIAQIFLAEFEHQLPTTRSFIERLPVDKFTWKPHDRSMTAGQLALHIASWPGHIVRFVANNPVQARGETAFPQPFGRGEILQAFEESIAIVRETLPTYTDEILEELWRLIAGDKEVFVIPRGTFLREVMFSHMYHHRGQLSVYLRMLDIPVPASYGPSADEVPSFMQKEEPVTLD